MIEGRPRESLVLYENPMEVSINQIILPSQTLIILFAFQVSEGMDPLNPMRRTFGSGKCTIALFITTKTSKHARQL